jgi:hypothetical protein
MISPRKPIDRPETLAQAKRWDTQCARARAWGLCDRCSSQYSWGLQLGFTQVHPPCDSCAELLADAVGTARIGGWRNLRLTKVAPHDTTDSPRAHRSRTATPAKYVDGFGQCERCGAQWTGYQVCHCTVCHGTFTSEAAFKRHRLRGKCQDPEARELVKVFRAHWVGWGCPTS